jgi:hypothetical protein
MFSIQIDVDVVAAARAATLSHTAKHDLDMLLKTILTEAFGGAVVRPWVLHRHKGPLAIILGYSKMSAAGIEERLGVALPSCRTAIKGVYGHALPVLTAGQRFRFSVRLCRSGLRHQKISRVRMARLMHFLLPFSAAKRTLIGKVSTRAT